MWAHVINAALGIWLMAAPVVLQYSAPAQTDDRIIGPVIATFAIVAWWEATRPVGRWNLPLGLWLLLAPWVLGYGATTAVVNSLVVGLLVAGLSLVRGQYRPEKFGGGWSVLWQKTPASGQNAQRR